jgi:hypothetical protein
MALAPLELLPTEVLQDIFLSCLNLNLPLSSPYIASKLSSTHCYLGICSAFLSAPIGDRTRQTGVQTKILAMKWMTWELFKVRKVPVNERSMHLFRML